MDEKRRLEEMKELITGGADVNATANDGATALMRACAFSSFNVISLLLSHGANLHIKTKDNRGLFHYVALRRIEDGRMEELVDVLIKKGGIINEIDINGNSPLAIALDINNCNFAILLFRMNSIFCDTFDTNYNKNNECNMEKRVGKNDVELVVKVAQKEDDIKIIEEMMKYYPNTQTTVLVRAAITLRSALVRKLLLLWREGDYQLMDINGIYLGATALCKACHRDMEMMDLLLSYGADVCYY